MALPLNGHCKIIIKIEISVAATRTTGARASNSLEYFIEGLGRRSTRVIGIMTLGRSDAYKSVCIDTRLEMVKTSLHCIPG